jgi:hypothetical protein
MALGLERERARTTVPARIPAWVARNSCARSRSWPVDAALLRVPSGLVDPLQSLHRRAGIVVFGPFEVACNAGFDRGIVAEELCILGEQAARCLLSLLL